MALKKERAAEGPVKKRPDATAQRAERLKVIFPA